jgi:hypothetical protein
VVRIVDAREVRELALRQPGLRTAEAPLARAPPEALEQRRHGRGVPVSQGSDRDPVDVARVHRYRVNVDMARSLPRGGPSC